MPSSFLQSCAACKHEFAAPAHLVGRTIACPHCRRPLAIHGNEAKRDILIGQKVAGHRLVRRLGAGSFGIVYQATPLPSKTAAPAEAEALPAAEAPNRDVAIKMIGQLAASRGNVLERFKREAELGAKIQHRNVVAMRSVGIERGAHYLMMEYVDGPNLATQVEDTGPFPWRHAVRIAIEICEGLGAIHALGIIHRDIKPANVLVGGDGVAKLADLGLAKQLEPDEGDDPSGLTMQGVPLGSPAFMPPEQVRSARDATEQSDVYSVGATLFFLLSGHLPFDGVNAMDIMGKVLDADSAPLRDYVPDLPPAVAEAVERMMDKDPARRPQGCQGALVLLRRSLEISTLQVRAPTAARPALGPAPAATGLGLPIGLLAIIAIAAIALIVLLIVALI